MFSSRKRFVYMSGMHSGTYIPGSKHQRGGSGPSGSSSPQPQPRPPFNPDSVVDHTMPPEQTPLFQQRPELVNAAYAAIIAGDSARFAHLMTEIGAALFHYDVDYANAVMKYFSDFERGINSIRASMQGFSTDKGDYKLGPIEAKAFQKAKELIERAGFRMDEVPGGDVVQRILDAYNNGQKTISISKQDANRVMQFLAQVEDKVLPSEFKQEVLSAQLESSNKKRTNFFEATMPALLKNMYDR